MLQGRQALSNECLSQALLSRNFQQAFGYPCHSGACPFRNGVDQKAPYKRYTKRLRASEKASQPLMVNALASESQSSRVEIAELVILLQVRKGVSDEDAEGLLDSIWSLQYMTGRGILCAFAGQIDSEWTKSNAENYGPPEDLRGIQPTHAVHIRFTDLPAAFRFQKHTEVVKVFESKVKEICPRYESLLFKAEVVMDMEEMFRRGPGFGAGVEHILTLQARDRNNPESEVYCSQLGQIAVSRLCNAVQSQVGQCIQADSDSSSPEKLLVVMSRFEDVQDAERFAMLPPVARILNGEEDIPVRLVLQNLFVIAGTQRSKSSTPEASRLH